MKQGILRRACIRGGMVLACLILMMAMVFPTPALASNARKVPVLTYHKVVSNKRKRKNPEARMTVSIGEFNRQMRWLRKKHYTAITCDQLYLWHEGKLKLPRRSVLITFDDGYTSTIKRIIPVLEKYDLRATVFVIGAKTYYGDQSRYISVNNLRKLQKSCPYIEFQSHTWNLHNKKRKPRSYALYAEDARRQKAEYGFDYVAYPFGFITKKMIRAYRDNGIKMGFLFGDKYNGFATRKQKRFAIRRLEVPGTMTMDEFKKMLEG